MSRITLFTHWLPNSTEDYGKLADLTIPNRDEYCQRHGYTHLVQAGPYKHPEWYYGFDRLLRLRDALDEPGASQFIWTLNAQSVITNLTKTVENLVDNEHDFWVSKDVHGINLGSFIVRNSAWSREWLDFLISTEPVYRDQPWKDQRAVMDWWLHEKWTWKTHLLPQRAFNSYQYFRYPPWPSDTPGNWRPGDFVLSMPGTTLKERLEIVTATLAGDMMIR